MYEFLEKVLDQIRDPENWVCGSFEIYTPDGTASRCLVGAITSVETIESFGRFPKPNDVDVRLIVGPDAFTATAILAALLPEDCQENLTSFNDRYGHAAVVELLQFAIREEKIKAGVAIDIPEPAESEMVANEQQ